MMKKVNSAFVSTYGVIASVALIGMACWLRLSGDSTPTSTLQSRVTSIQRPRPVLPRPVVNPTTKADTFVAAQLTGSSTASGWTCVIARLGGDGRLTAQRVQTVRALQGDVYRRLPLVQSVALRIPRRNLNRLAALPWVERLALDSPVQKSDEFTVSRSGADFAATQYGLSGFGVGVAVLDSGVRSHQDLTFTFWDYTFSRVFGFANFAPDAAQWNEDPCGHGTHIAGIIAGNGLASSQEDCFRTFYGVARDAHIVNVRVLDSQGHGTVSGVISGINWVIQNKSRLNIRVLNISLGHPVGESYKTDPLCQAVEAAWKAGIVVVCAAGNEGRGETTRTASGDNEGWGTAYGSIQSPANDPYVITVGAMKASPNGRNFDQVATYSSRGPTVFDHIAKPDIMAPGNHVISTSASGSFLESAFGGSNLLPYSAYRTDRTGNSSKYFVLSGTSMAAPVVAGAAALLIERDPSLSPDTIKARLMLTASKWKNSTGAGAMFTYGAGYLDIPAALTSSVTAWSAALSPVVVRDAFGKVWIDPSQSIWSFVNGKKVVWGVSNVTGLQVIWGGVTVKDIPFVNGTQVLWGGSQPVDGINIEDNQVLWRGTGETFFTDSVVDLTSVALWGE